MVASNMTEFLKRRATTIIAYAVALILCLGFLALVLRLNQADLAIPFVHAKDALVNSILIKSMIETGWVWRNPHLGAPFGTQFFDFPFFDTLNVVLLKVISLVTSNYAVVLNLFFLLTFPLTVLSSMLTLRAFKVSYPSAIVASLLFSFIPYHFRRGEGHLFLSAYFLVPLMTMVVLWLWIGDTLLEGQEPDRLYLSRRQIVSMTLICGLVGSSFAYYAFFGCYFLVVAGLVAAIRFRHPMRLAWGIGLASVIFAVLIINESPSWLYTMRNGPNEEVAKRIPREADMYGLKVTALLLPISGHRLEFLRDIRQAYDKSTIPTEGGMASLGVVGDFGFIFLLGWLFCSPRRWPRGELLNALAVLTLSAVLLGTVGGLGSLFNFLISPRIRAYNRISVYIAFFSLFAVALLLDDWKRWMGERKSRTYLWYGVLAAILCLGILDQTSSSFAPDYAGSKSRYQSDAKFVAEVEASVPAGAMLFQLPNVRFPETAPVAQLQAYDELKAYLHSRSLRWSSGAMRGRPEALWAEHNELDSGGDRTDIGPDGKRRLILQLPPQSLKTLALAGFSGIYIDRLGFMDSGISITRELQQLLGEDPMVSGDGRLVFFHLTTYAQALRAKYTPQQWEAERRRVLEVPSFPEQTNW